MALESSKSQGFGSYELTSGAGEAELVLTYPDGQLHSILNINELCCNQHLLGKTYLTPADLATYTTCFAESLGRYYVRRPDFPLDTLLQLTELGKYWLDLAHDAARLYDANQYDEFEAALEEIITTVQIDMEEDHRIPYNKHRHYDTILIFKVEYDGRIYCHDSATCGITPSYYAYLTVCLDVLQKAVISGCGARLQC